MSSRSRSTELSAAAIAVALALLAALIIHILTPILAWQWTRLPFIGAQLEHTLVVGAIEDTGAGTGTGLEYPSRIVAVNGATVTRYRDLSAILRTLSPGESVYLSVEALNQTGKWETQTTQVQLATFSPADLIVRFVVPYLVGLCYLGMGVYTLYQRRIDAKARAFAFFCALASVALSASFDRSSTHVLTRLWTVSIPASALALVYLGLEFLPVEGTRHHGLVIRLVPLIPVAAVATWAQIELYTQDPRSYFAPWLVSFVLLAIGVLAFVVLLVYTCIKPSFTRLRLQAKAVLLGTVIALSSALMWIAASAVGRLVESIGVFYRFDPLAGLVALIAFPLSFIYATDRYQFLSADPLSSLLYHSPGDYRNTIRDFTRELAVSLDVAYIVDKLLSYVGRTLHPQHTAIFMVAESDMYELYQTWGDADRETLADVRFTHHDRLIARLQRDGRGLLLTPPTLESLHLDADERARVDRLSAVLVVPLRSKEHLLGLLAMGPLTSGDMYAADDVLVLDTMADQAAVAAENALLYSRQVQQEYRLLQQTRRLTDILALGNQLKSLDLDLVVKSTVKAVHGRLGFDLVTLSLIEENDPTRVRVVAWEGIESTTWERLTSTSFPVLDFEAIDGMQRVEHCFLICAPGTTHKLSTPQNPVPWHEGDQLYVPLTAGEELLGYLTVDRPEDGQRPTDDTIEVLEIFANQAAIAIQNANLYARIDRALDERVAELATLQEIDTQLNVKLDFDYVMNVTLEWAMRTTSSIAGTLALVSPDRTHLYVVAHSGYPPQADNYWDTPWPIGEGITGQVAQTGDPIMIEDVTQYADYVDVNIASRSHLAAPIKREGQVIGTIGLESPEPNGFTVDDLSFLLRLADHAAIAIENVRLYEQTNRRVAELTALQQISLDLTSSLDLGAVLDSVAANTFVLTEADEITIYLYDEHEDVLSFGTGLSRLGKEESPPIPIPENELTNKVARQGVPTIIHDNAEHPFSLSKWQIGAIASIPLQKAGHVLGVFDIVFDQPHQFTQDELRALNLLADQAAIAIQNAQLFLEVQRANEAKSEFVSIVSHELKVPMTSIQGYARLMTLGAAGPVSQQQLEFANTILRNVERMSNLVSDLLDLARIESGRIKISPRSVELSKIIRDAVRSVQTQIEARSHVLEIAVADNLSVYVDPARIIQVWINLLSNAYKYTPRGGQIKAWARMHNGREGEGTNTQWVLCAVSDSGVGIEPKDQERIFEEFYRVQRSETGDEPGTGLGLSITRSIIELHGGHIWVESELGQGSTFYFTLPTA